MTISGVKTGRSFRDTNILTAVILAITTLPDARARLYFAREGGEPGHAGRKVVAVKSDPSGYGDIPFKFSHKKASRHENVINDWNLRSSSGFSPSRMIMQCYEQKQKCT